MDPKYNNIANFTLVTLLGDLAPGDVLNPLEKKFEELRGHIGRKRVRAWGKCRSELDYLLARYLTKLNGLKEDTTGEDFVKRFKDRPIKPLLKYLNCLGIKVNEILAKQLKRYILWGLEYKSLQLQSEGRKAESVEPMPNPSPWVYNSW